MSVTEDLQRAVRDMVSRADTLSAVRAMETSPDAWRDHWPAVADLGLLSITADGGTLADQAAAVEEAARGLVPGPVLPSVLTSVLLGSPMGIAVTAGDVTVSGGRASGNLTPVMFADGPVLFRAGDTWFTGTGDVTPLTPVDFSRPLCRVRFDDVPVTATDLDTTRVLDLAATLFAAEAAGIARWCLDTAVEYAKIRTQFGRPIGSFQAIKHLCAEMLCRTEQAAALAWDAARGGELSAPAAAAFAVDAAVENAKDCVQVLGGIGFTWEHDAHLYLRRALANRQLLGGTARWRREVAGRALAGVRRTLVVDADDDETRAAAREFARSVAGLSTAEQRVRLADSGYLTPHWPRPYGLAASPRAQVVIDDELAAAGIHRPDLVIGAWAVPTILAHGTEEQQKRFAGPTLRGELDWCQLFSEPGAGSDLAALRTKATRTEGGWLLNGQKVWTSRAAEADWAICLARTDPDAPKHKGITYFLVDMRSAGITLRPLRELTGESRFNEVFLDDVFVPDDCQVGEVNGGWPLARTTLANERVALGAGSALGEGVERLLALASPSNASNTTSTSRSGLGDSDLGSADSSSPSNNSNSRSGTISTSRSDPGDSDLGSADDSAPSHSANSRSSTRSTVGSGPGNNSGSGDPDLDSSSNSSITSTSSSGRGNGSSGSVGGVGDSSPLPSGGSLGAEARERIGALVAQGLSVSLVDLRATLRQLDGRAPGPESSVCKLVGVRHRQDVAEAAVDLLGAAGAAVDEATGPALHEFLLTRCLSIAGGTTQVLRTLIGERILGLPRE